MLLRRLRLMTFVPCVGIGFLLLSPKVTGIVSALVLVGVLITLHELGHFLAARRMGAPVDVFSIGFGPRLFGFQWKETDVRLAAVPLGGYVRLAGEDSEVGTGLSEDHSFFKKSYGQRMLFYSGGIIANVLTAFVIFTAVSVYQSRVVAMHPEPSPLLVMDVIKGGAAEAAGLKVGDQINRLGPLAFPGASDQEAIAHIRSMAGKPLELEVTRMGSTLKITATPKDEGGAGRIGIQFQPSRFQYDMRAIQVGDLWTGLKAGLQRTGNSALETARGYSRLFTFRISASEVGGPIAIVRSGSQAAQDGWMNFFMFAAFISMNLAVLNALPIPGLDGSHALILTIERLRRKNFTIAVKERILTTGFYLLLGLLVFVMGLDLWRLKS